MRRNRSVLFALGAMVAVASVLIVATAAAASTVRSTVRPPNTLSVGIFKSGMGADAERVSLNNFAIEPGLPFTVAFVNHTRQYHTFTVPGLGLSALILPARGNQARTTTVTFTAHTVGVFDWFCTLCPDHGQQHMTPMHGKVYGIIAI